jgi:glucose/mannose-6-phosphate isomerase
VNLDDAAHLAEVDRRGALDDVEASPDQWSEASTIAVPVQRLDDFRAVVVTGVGGSGICGDLVAACAADRAPVPVWVHKSYGLPAFAGPGSLVVAVSCSGDTRETRSAAEEALQRGATLFAVTAGGALGRLCDDRGIPWLKVPRKEQPRHSLGYLAVPTLRLLGLDEGVEEAIEVQRRVVAACGRTVATPENPSKRLGLLAAEIGAATVIGGDDITSAAAYRLKCQLNENAKLPASFGRLPELAHNEIAAWEFPPVQTALMVVLRDPGHEDERLARSFAIVERLAADRFKAVEAVPALGQAPLARMASLILQADLSSVYAAVALDRDPSPIRHIDRFKEQLP